MLSALSFATTVLVLEAPLTLFPHTTARLTHYMQLTHEYLPVVRRNREG